MITSCKESFFDINTDPNNPATATPKWILPSGIAGSCYVIGGYYQNLGGFWSQHYAQATSASQWLQLEMFNLDESDFDRQFNSLYNGPLMDFESIKKTTLASKDWSYYTIATLMQSYTFEVLADLYDQIPFSESLQGLEKLSPKYEKGIDIYDSLIHRINFAINQNLTANTVSKVGTEDLIFSGDMDKWIQFANTLKLKMYLRFVNIDANKYKAEIQALLTENNFLLTPACMTAFKDEENGRNPFYETFMDRLAGNVAASKTLIDTLINTADPRLTAIFIPAEASGIEVGIGQGRYKEDQSKYANYKNLSTPNVTGLSPVYLFTVPEVYFLIAEAELRYGSAANAETNYISGINASFDMLHVTQTPSMYNTPSSAYYYNGLYSIMLQKWIAAANTTAIESFFDKNRTGYPSNFVASPVSVLTPGATPQRLLFPETERKSNPNTPKRVNLDTKVWFTK